MTGTPSSGTLITILPCNDLDASERDGMSARRPFADPLLALQTGTLLSSRPTPGQAA